MKKKKISLREVNPKLASELHPTKNGTLSSEEISSMLNKKFWWLCEFGHEWMSSLNQRLKGVGCPYCSTRNAKQENS